MLMYPDGDIRLYDRKVRHRLYAEVGEVVGSVGAIRLYSADVKILPLRDAGVMT